MSINFNSINIIWGWDWMSPPLFAIDLPWIPWVDLPWGCPIITISCTPQTQVVRPIYIKVCCRRNLPHYTAATLFTLHYLPPPPPWNSHAIAYHQAGWGTNMGGCPVPSSLPHQIRLDQHLSTRINSAWPAPPSPQDGTLPVSLAPRNSHICCSGETTNNQANVSLRW